jgi:hypothetical protein
MSDQLVAEAAPYTKNTQQTNIQALSGIRARYSSNRAAADLRLTPSAHRNRLQTLNT